MGRDDLLSSEADHMPVVMDSQCRLDDARIAISPVVAVAGEQAHAGRHAARSCGSRRA
jgi:hypothetical protein